MRFIELMIMDNLKREIILHYMDLVGMVTIDYDPTPESTKNGLMHTGLTMLMYRRLGWLDINDIEAFRDTVEACQEIPGVYDRYPSYNGKPRNNDENAHDDAAGVFGGSKACGLMFHYDILNHGIHNHYVYNNVNPNVLIDDINPLKWEWWAFRLRFLDHIIWYYLGNNRLQFLSPLLMLWIALRVKTAKVGSPRILLYIMVESLALKSKLWTWFRSWFIVRSKLVESVEDYFKIVHPLVNVAKMVVKS